MALALDLDIVDSQFPIQTGGKDRIAVMNEELARMITG